MRHSHRNLSTQSPRFPSLSTFPRIRMRLRIFGGSSNPGASYYCQYRALQWLNRNSQISISSAYRRPTRMVSFFISTDTIMHCCRREFSVLQASLCSSPFTEKEGAARCSTGCFESGRDRVTLCGRSPMQWLGSFDITSLPQTCRVKV